MTAPTTRAVPVPFTRVWQDKTPITTVLICGVCKKQFGPYLTGFQSDINADAKEHWSTHHPNLQGYTREEAARYSPCAADDDCRNKVVAGALCMKHYQRARRARLEAAA